MNFKLLTAILFVPILLGCLRSNDHFKIQKYTYTFTKPSVFNVEFKIKKNIEKKVDVIAYKNKKINAKKTIIKNDRVKIQFSGIDKKIQIKRTDIKINNNEEELKHVYKLVDGRIHNIDLKEEILEEAIRINEKIIKLDFNHLVENFKLPNDELIAKSEIVKDKVNIESASVKKTEEFDLQFYDYSEQPKIENKKVQNLNIQNKQEFENNINGTNSIVEIAKNKENELFNIKFPISAKVEANKPQQIPLIKETQNDSKSVKQQERPNSIAPIIASNTKQDDYSDVFKSNSKSDHNSKMSIQIQEVKIGYSKNISKNFQISYLDDYKEVDEDYSTGTVKILKNINGVKQIRESLIQSFNKETYATRTELVFEKGEFEIFIPIFNIETLSKLNSNNYYESYLVVELDEKIEDIEISNFQNKKSYYKKIYLNEEYQIVNKEDNEYRYILFVGIKPGNRIINYSNEKEVKSRIIFINENEVFFESINFKKEKRDEIKLYSKDILNKGESMLDIMAENFISLQNEKKSIKNNMNTYYFKEDEYLLNTRKYYEIQREDKSVFIGRENSNKVIVPNEIYINEIITRFNIDELKERCIVQLNLTKNIKEITYDGIKEKYNIELNSFAIDDQGQIIDHADVYSKNFFIKGDVGSDGGVISIKINYTDGTVDYIKSFCSPSTYLVEQL